MAPPRYRITLTEEERRDLEALTSRGKLAVSKFKHARALLLCDAGPHGAPLKVAEAAKALGVTSRTVEKIKKRFVEEGRKVLRQPWNGSRAPRRIKSLLTATSPPG